ncbi:metal ABC transporter solute-binding protein, Zn/Mn family [Candidatus Neptunochlamydia vexilliferae]|uniref:Metal-binding lipoprotein n=1 Tax=Candidatus Neptunichlamydia vexilliferae TaxID=1651774 RepID=A0ABS0AY79_9BACT|nr:zinc ABC transporter substrate-binding protein [Candidatus Neptunochlamydia vexilliferae]MBF5058920.1 putative metal-binding lipoprotein [Candidatus Neptunochlamydia vexilliferae]
MRQLLLVLSLCFLAACGKPVNQSYMEESGKVKVLSTTAMIDDLVAAVGGEEIDHLSLIVGDLDPHSYELVKGDDEKLARADLIFYNGLGLEHGASLSKHLDFHPEALPLGDILYRQNPDSFIVIEGQLDPHFWMDVALFAQTIDPIVAALSKKAPQYASLFKERGEVLKKEMMERDQSLLSKMQAIPAEKRYLVTSHDAFYYFAKRYLAAPEEKEWKNRFIAPEGLAPDGQMSILDIQAVSEFLCAHHIETVFPESNINQDALKKIAAICKEKGLDVKIAPAPLYGDTMGEKESYLEMMKHNGETLNHYLP